MYSYQEQIQPAVGVGLKLAGILLITYIYHSHHWV